MAVNPLIFKNAENVRDSITESQKKDIAKLYNDWADKVGKMADYYARKDTSSAPVSERYYRELQKQLRTTSQEVSNEVYKKIKSNMYTVSDAVVADNVNWLKQFGFLEDGLNAAFSYVPDSIVRSIVTGQVYESGWSLSDRIWGNNEQTLKELYKIVAGGVAQQMPIKDITKQLEQYVRPGAAKQWNLVDKDGRRIYPRQVDYNAQRLARTLVQHSYQQSFDAVNHNNPFVIDYVWNANGSRVCEICMDRDGRHYDKDNLPLDHPNGMCTMEPNIDDNMEDKLVEWFNSEDGTFPEIDEFAKNFGYETAIASKPSTWQEWSKTVPFEEWKKFSKEAKKLGMTFDEYYKVYNGQTSNVTPIVNSKPKVTKDVKKVVEKPVAVKSVAEKPVEVQTTDTVDVSGWKKQVKSNKQSAILAMEKEKNSSFTEEEKRAIRAYTGIDYHGINEYLRTKATGENAEIDQGFVKSANLITSALNKTKLEEDMYVHRMTDVGDLAGLFMNGNFQENKEKLEEMKIDELAKMFEGAVGEYTSFTSTSSNWNKGTEYNDLEVIMRLPKGTSAASIMKISQYGTDEAEMLLNAGTKVKCVKIEKSEDKDRSSNMRKYLKTTVYLEVIPK